jgi:hypothetical protein
MKKVVLYLLIFNFISCSSVSSDVQEESKEIPYFDVKFPCKDKDIEYSVNNIIDEDYTITLWYMRGADSQGNQFMYIVGHNKLSTSLKEKYTVSIDDLLIESLRGNATKLGGENLQFNKIRHNGYDGIEMICDVFNGEGVLKGIAFKISNDIFLLSAGGQNIDEDSINTFFNSFKLTPSPSKLNILIIKNSN